MFARKENVNLFVSLYPITCIIGCIQIILYVGTQLPVAGNSMLDLLMGTNLHIHEGQYWRLITPTFLHSTFPHFMFNTMSLLILAPAAETMMGRLRFILFYIGCGLGANLASFLLLPAHYAHLGASGAIFGLIGFYMLIVISQPDLMSKQDSTLIKVLACVAFVMTFIQPNTNIVAHISGFAVGMCCFWALPKTPGS
ncbi:rhomboid family intramembrane serine protease [Bacillus testis]|uniref:rhomboid family intramembrane serine protease n=1 Tax=Bacillus testis TaxID=1622072 RepID=UPI00067EFA33|nr:rhomboid family intramembrane serine protease [Bacillus testis]